MQHDLVVTPQRSPLMGSVPAPPDEDLGHLALLMAALADGQSVLRRLSKGRDVAAMIAALQQLGVPIDADPDGTVRVTGRGLRGLLDAGQPVACAQSIVTLRRLAAVLVAHPFPTMLAVDAANGGSEMTAVAAALRRRAAQIEGVFSRDRVGEVVAPFTVGPLAVDRALSGIEYEAPRPHRDVKEVLLLSGLYADEGTYVKEAIVSRDHLERMLVALAVPLAAAGPIVALDPTGWSARIEPFSFEVPGDLAAACLLSAMATIVPESRISVRAAGLNPTRTGAFDLLRQMGGAVETVAQTMQLGEAEGTVSASYAPLRAVTMDGESMIRASDDLAALVIAAARARGATEIATIVGPGTDALGSDAARLTGVLRAFGVEAEAMPGGLRVVGRPEEALDPADIDAAGDAGVVVIGVALGLVAGGPTRIRHADAVAERYPRLVGILRALGADLRVERVT